MMFAVVLCVVGLSLCSAKGASDVPEKDCCHLSGEWRNQHGSLMMLNHSSDGVLTGRFMTAVEASHGASKGAQHIHGRVGDGRPTTFGFTVVFKNGKSNAAWSGQYHLCNGIETLLTTWILTSATETCQEGWMASRVGQDEFVRVNQTNPLTEPQFYSKRIIKKTNKKHNRKMNRKTKKTLRQRRIERMGKKLAMKKKIRGQVMSHTRLDKQLLGEARKRMRNSKSGRRGRGKGKNMI